jgi:hypothetical protein
MTESDNIRLTALEWAFSEGTIGQSDIAELESLRDNAGMGWLFDSCSQVSAGEPCRDYAGEIARRQETALIGYDKGEQADLFGQGLLL